MTIPALAAAFAAGTLTGAAIAARRARRTHPDVALQARLDQAEALARDWRAYAQRLAARHAQTRGAVARWARSAAYWHAEAEAHRVVLEALGRRVASGGTLVEDE